MREPSACYGKRFPATLVKTENEDVQGKVFGYRIEHTGVIETGRMVRVRHQGLASLHHVEQVARDPLRDSHGPREAACLYHLSKRGSAHADHLQYLSRSDEPHGQETGQHHHATVAPQPWRAASPK